MTDGTNGIRVLLVDDHATVRRGNTLVLESTDDLRVVGEAPSGEEAVALARSLRPDIVLMDVRMPGIGGIEATRRIIAADDRVRVIVLTTFDLDEYAFASLKAGASGFLLKSATADELVSAIRTVASGDAVLGPRVTRRLIDAFVVGERRGGDRPGGTGGSGRLGPRGAGLGGERGPGGLGRTGLRAGLGGGALRGGELSDAERPDATTEGAAGHGAVPDPRMLLSPRELDVFIGIGEGLSNAELGERLHLSVATVKTHVNRILAKLHARDRVHLVIMAYEHGMAPPPPSR